MTALEWIDKELNKYRGKFEVNHRGYIRCNGRCPLNKVYRDRSHRVSVDDLDLWSRYFNMSSEEVADIMESADNKDGPYRRELTKALGL